MLNIYQILSSTLEHTNASTFMPIETLSPMNFLSALAAN